MITVTVEKYDAAKAEHRDAYEHLSLDDLLEPADKATLHLVSNHGHLDGYTYQQTNGKWFVHTYLFDPTPAEADSPEEAGRLIASLAEPLQS